VKPGRDSSGRLALYLYHSQLGPWQVIIQARSTVSNGPQNNTLTPARPTESTLAPSSTTPINVLRHRYLQSSQPPPQASNVHIKKPFRAKLFRPRQTPAGLTHVRVCFRYVFLSASFGSVPDFPSLTIVPALNSSEPPTTLLQPPSDCFPPPIPPEQMSLVRKCVLSVLRSQSTPAVRSELPTHPGSLSSRTWYINLLPFPAPRALPHGPIRSLVLRISFRVSPPSRGFSAHVLFNAKPKLQSCK